MQHGHHGRGSQLIEEQTKCRDCGNQLLFSHKNREGEFWVCWVCGQKRLDTSVNGDLYVTETHMDHKPTGKWESGPTNAGTGLWNPDGKCVCWEWDAEDETVALIVAALNERSKFRKMGLELLERWLEATEMLDGEFGGKNAAAMTAAEYSRCKAEWTTTAPPCAVLQKTV